MRAFLWALWKLPVEIGRAAIHYARMTDIAASRFYRAVRKFAVNEPVWSSARVIVQTLPSDRYDLTDISQRVYGNRNEFLAVMAAAGLTRFDDVLTERELVLPSKEALAAIKADVGYDSASRSVLR